MGHYRRSAAALVAAQAGKLLRLGLAAMIDCTCPPQYLNVIHSCRGVQRGLLISLSRRQNGHHEMVAAARMGEQAFCRCILALGAAFALVMLFLCLN